ncbi:HU family DNA-binding protein [Sphingobacterium wenxiniae]|uniref:DNA-binding protein, histone-like, putative n=1 Tax=Sphingobacterium wenxiniae TaxID=683125 RepID=A0A1I6R613_9SPHI|nr:HU family DNA-binding protein [Sphingobacterium wenxiniae]SFS60147.1 DNA-binding protein, histone-like, putative [Sphingobacterium wenxiniae]
MSIKYNVHEIGNAIDPTAPKKFYVRPISSGEITLDELASQISHSCSLTEADVYGVLHSLIREIPRALADGYIVRLGNLGSFRMSINSTGSDSPQEVSEENIYKRRLIFTAGKQMKKALEKIQFEKNE